MKAAIDKDRHWYVVRTNVKAEDKASANIRKAGYDVYYPRRRVEVKNKRTHTTDPRNPADAARCVRGLPQADRNFFKVRGCAGVECILGAPNAPALCALGET
jgi:transcription termination/antitermination protein NusG